MPDNLHQYCATDKEIYDLLISGKQRLTETVLRELARDRGIFYSPKDSRETLVDHLAVLTHDYYDVTGIMQRREHSKRNEKTTSLTLSTDLTIDEIRDVVQAYQNEVCSTEKVTSFQKGSEGFVMNVEYDEYDYSRTRLIQRQRKDAGIEFVMQNGKTTIRMPATEKAKTVVENLKDKLEGNKKSQIPVEEIELTGLTRAEDRTAFFTSLISKLPGYSQLTVTNLKVASDLSSQHDSGVDIEEDEESEDAAKEAMLTVVRSVALNGQNLVASPEYQSLRQRGFFITSVTWRSKQLEEPHAMVQFDAGFDNASEGKGFRYGVRCASRLQSGEYAKNFRPPTDMEKASLFELIERTARQVLADVYAASAVSNLESDGEDAA